MARKSPSKNLFVLTLPLRCEAWQHRGTDPPGHGIGVSSICAIVERYGGLYSFSVREGKFVLRVSL